MLLHVELTPGVSLEVEGVRPNDVALQLTNLGWLGSMAMAVALDGLDSPHLSTRGSRLNEPLLIRAQIGSPLSMVLSIPGDLLTNASAFALLGYGLKRLWALDLELKSHRLQMKTRYYDILREAEEARQRADSIIHHVDLRREPATWETMQEEKNAALDKDDEGRGWAVGTSAAIEGRRSPYEEWRGEAFIADE